MPELPEVETIARTLAPSVTGRSLVGVEVLNPKTWQGDIPPESLCADGPRRILGTGRRAKVLLLHFEPARGEDGIHALNGLAFHLKMTGQLFAREPGTPPEKHTRALFHLDDGSRLFFNDSRKFGYVRGVSPAALEAWPFWKALGPEPLTISGDDFVRLFEGRNGAMKALLLNQSVIVGVGNIYADESLFRAGIRPDTPASRVQEKRMRRLRDVLVEVLEESIRECGSSIRDYRTAGGDAGAFQNSFRVYGRGGQPCVQCGRELKQAKVAGRTTVYCPACQAGG